MALCLIGYDIHNAKRRRRALFALRAISPCRQDSYFETGEVRDRWSTVVAGLKGDLDPLEDGLVVGRAMSPCVWQLGHRWTVTTAGLYLVS